MAESPYLRFQDKNNDGLIDICETDNITPTKNCPPCERKPNAIVPLWKNQLTREPWFNEKYCLFQCTVVTGIDSIIPPANSGLTDDEYVVQLFESNQNIAINSLLEKFNKAKSTKNNQTLVEAIDYTKYDLDPRPGSVLKLLYSVDSDIFALLEDAEAPSDDADDVAGEVVVKYRADDLFSKLMKFRKAMYLFSRYYRVYQATEGGLYYFEDGSAFTTSKFDRYGDAGFFVGNSIMADILKDLDNWLNDRGYNIFGVGSISFFRDRVTDLEFTFNAEYELIKLSVWTINCGNKPTNYKDGQLSGLLNYNSFSDKTAMAYFTKLNEMESHLSARVERPWTEFVEQYTYPKISNAVNNFGNNGGPTALSCVGDALLEEGKQLGQDIVDDIFSIGDAIAYAFHKSVCKKSLGEIQLEQEQYGQVYKKDPKTGKDKVDFGKLKDPKTGNPTKISEMAISQAFEKLEDSDQPFVQMCAALLQGSLPLGTSNKTLINSLFRDGLAESSSAV